MLMRIIYILSLFLIFSCSHHHKKSAHHHHDGKAACEKCAKESKVAFDKKCAHAVMEGDTHVEGKKEFSLTHEGRKYYFSSKDRMKKFQTHLDEHVDQANKQWARANKK